MSDISKLEYEIKRINRELLKLTIMKQSKQDSTIEPAHYLEATFINTGDSSSDYKYQLATGNEIMNFEVDSSTTLDFTYTSTTFSPPKTGYYNVETVFYGTETYSITDDPLNFYIIEMGEEETDCHLFSSYKTGPTSSTEAIQFNQSYLECYHSQNVLRLDSEKQYNFFVTANTDNSIPDSTFNSINGITTSQYDLSKLNPSRRQFLFVKDISKLFVHYIGPTHPR